jgi:flagellar protein FliS
MTTLQSDARSAYTGNTVSTASPAALLVMLVDRLVLDVERGLRCQMAGDGVAGSQHLQHAQAIVTELQATLDVEGWTGGRELMGLYVYIQKLLVRASAQRNQRAAKEAVLLCRHLRDTWKQAAALAARGR